MNSKNSSGGSHRAPILVGYDGSPGANLALDWALAEAARHHAPLRLVYVYEWAAPVVPVPAAYAWPCQTIRHEAVIAVAQAVDRARRSHREVSITGSVIDGLVVPILRMLSERARMVVLGNRGLGGFTGLLAGSVAVDVAAHAACPVVVVRGQAAASQPVVVGVDDSADAQPAIAFALEEAVARGVGLVAVRAWQPAPVPWRYQFAPAQAHAPGDLATADRHLLDEALHGWHDKYPEIEITPRLVASTAARALIDASYHAQLVVVGARGRGAFPGLLLGSVGRQLLHHADCPVAVVRRETPHH